MFGKIKLFLAPSKIERLTAMEKISNLVKHLVNEHLQFNIVRKAGYFKDQSGIMQRYLREGENWQHHLKNTKQFIIESIDQCNEKNNLAVLGSGWLLDVPIEELAGKFDQVDLIDIVHPAQVKNKLKRFANVSFLPVDLTHGLVEAAAGCKSYSQFQQIMKNQKPDLGLNKYSLVISVNLLNQLDIILCDYLSKRFGTQPMQMMEIRKIVQEQHIMDLPLGKTCLITDFIEINLHTRTGFKSEKNLIYCTLPQVTNEQFWEWEFDTHQTYHQNFNTIFKVRAVQF
jgi:hypothetical protein